MAALPSTDDVLGLTAQIVSAHLSANTLTPDALPSLIPEAYKALAGIGDAPHDFGQAGARYRSRSRSCRTTSSVLRTARS